MQVSCRSEQTCRTSCFSIGRMLCHGGAPIWTALTVETGEITGISIPTGKVGTGPIRTLNCSINRRQNSLSLKTNCFVSSQLCAQLRVLIHAPTLVRTQKQNKHEVMSLESMQNLRQSTFKILKAANDTQAPENIERAPSTGAKRVPADASQEVIKRVSTDASQEVVFVK